MIFAFCVGLCAATFTGIGVFALRRQEPMWFWSGSMVRREELTDVAAYNRANGIMWLTYAAVYWLCIPVGMVNSTAGGIALVVVSIAGGGLLVVAYQKIYAKYAVRK